LRRAGGGKETWHSALPVPSPPALLQFSLPVSSSHFCVYNLPSYLSPGSAKLCSLFCLAAGIERAGMVEEAERRRKERKAAERTVDGIYSGDENLVLCMRERACNIHGAGNAWFFLLRPSSARHLHTRMTAANAHMVRHARIPLLATPRTLHGDLLIPAVRARHASRRRRLTLAAPGLLLKFSVL